MTNNRHPESRPESRRRDARNSTTVLHERYVRAVNAALQDGQDDVAHEIAATYADDLRRAELRHAA
jgi:hypothetical protein